MKELMRCDSMVSLELNTIERDTLLALLNDVVKIKRKASETAETAYKRGAYAEQAEIAKQLYDRIYKQKVEEYKRNGRF